MHSRQLASLVGRLYEAVTDERVWPVFLEELADALSSATTTLYLSNLASSIGTVGYAVRADRPRIAEFNEYYSKRTIWSLRGRHLLTEGRVVTGEMICTAAEVRRSEYSEYLDKLGVFHGFGAVIQKRGTAASMIASLRPTSRGAFGTSEVATLNYLMPHLQRAIQIHSKLAHCRLMEAGTLEALNQTSLGVVILDGAGQISFCNRAADVILSAADGLLTRAGELTAQNSSDAAALRRCIENARAVSRKALGDATSVVLVGRPSLKRPYGVTALPFPAFSELVPGLRQPGVAVCIRDPEDRPIPNLDIAQRIYGLTRSEVDICAALAQGSRVSGIALDLGITAGTTRWHLKRIFDKTGTASQADLVSLLLSCGAVSR